MCMVCTEQQMAEIFTAIKECKALRADEMPDEHAALRVMMLAYERLRALGWRSADYAPVGVRVETISAGSTGIHWGAKSERPGGGHWWWIEDGGDLWPGHPVLFRDPPKPAG